MAKQPDEEAQLIRKAKLGQADAFGVLYELHAVAIYRYLNAHLNSHLDAEDITSEVFVRAWKSLPKYHERGIPFRAYLFRIAHNALVDFYRQARDNQTKVLDDINAISIEPDPAEITMKKHKLQELEEILGEIRDDYRRVLVLRFINQLSPSETAFVMKRSPGAVRVLQHRALEALRQVLTSREIKRI